MMRMMRTRPTDPTGPKKKPDKAAKKTARRPGEGGRLTGVGLYAIVHRLGQAVGVHATPHGIRHTATTDAILCGRPLSEIQKFTRHRKLKTIQAYFDRAVDVAGQISAEIAATLG